MTNERICFRSYPHYKSSGVEWLGDVPTHWEVRRLKRVASLNPSKTESRPFLTADTPVTFLPMERVGTDGKIDEEVVPASSVWNGFTYFRRSDVLVAKITPCFENGKGACLDSLSTEIGFGSTEFHVLRSSPSVLSQFLYRLTALAEFRHSGAEEMTGAAGQQRVPQAFVANYPLPLPPLTEQTAIVRYLNHTDELIRRYVSSREQLIELLEEYRQAVIHHAVTRGLDPDVRLKSSGVEWLGDVPEHWEVLPLCAITTPKSIIGQQHRELLSVYLDRGVIRFSEAEEKRTNVTSEDLSKYQAVDPGDFVLNNQQAWRGSVGVSSHFGIVSPAYLVLSLSPRIHTGFANLLFRDQVMVTQYLVCSRGVGSIQRNLYWPHLKRVVFTLPPAPEQAAIVAYLEKATADIDVAIDRARREIEMLGEYRTRLIADVVTGKVDVREAAAELSAV